MTSEAKEPEPQATAPTPEPGEEIVLQGRIIQASNATFVGDLGERKVVYKPIAGEQPLWDFPQGSLAGREVAAHALSEAIGWEIVPPTWLGTGPFGPGMVQEWREPDPEQEAITVLPPAQVPETGWCYVFDGVDAGGETVALIHEDSAALRRMAIFDVLANNADRKGGHVLEFGQGHRYGVDHGLTFHTEYKLRTVLWGWMGQDLQPEEIQGVRRVVDALQGPLGEELRDLITNDERDALAARCELLLQTGTFPVPQEEFPMIPWPPF